MVSKSVLQNRIEELEGVLREAHDKCNRNVPVREEFQRLIAEIVPDPEIEEMDYNYVCVKFKLNEQEFNVIQRWETNYWFGYRHAVLPHTFVQYQLVRKEGMGVPAYTYTVLSGDGRRRETRTARYGLVFEEDIDFNKFKERLENFCNATK